MGTYLFEVHWYKVRNVAGTLTQREVYEDRETVRVIARNERSAWRKVMVRLFDGAPESWRLIGVALVVTK